MPRTASKVVIALGRLPSRVYAGPDSTTQVVMADVVPQEEEEEPEPEEEEPPQEEEEEPEPDVKSESPEPAVWDRDR